jgi:selenide,water dikinase
MAELAQVLRHVFPAEDTNALVDASTGDDAAVYLLEENRALVVTADFFTPIVDDPYQFGQIAAANALSDLYAMGARPLFALNLLAFPREHLDEGSLEGIIKGGAEKAREAGIPILGGHSIDDAEPKYGLVAIGEVDPRKMTTNAAARPGEHLVLTKAIGTGIIATAIKGGVVDEPTIRAATQSMAALNRGAAEAMQEAGIRAATDVTGFGLLGHLRQMLRASGVAARIEADAVPILPGAAELAERARFPGGSKRNLADVDDDVAFPRGMPESRRLLVPPEILAPLLERLRDRAPVAAVIGQIEEGLPGRIQIV